MFQRNLFARLADQKVEEEAERLKWRSSKCWLKTRRELEATIARQDSHTGVKRRGCVRPNKGGCNQWGCPVSMLNICGEGSLPVTAVGAGLHHRCWEHSADIRANFIKMNHSQCKEENHVTGRWWWCLRWSWTKNNKITTYLQPNIAGQASFRWKGCHHVGPKMSGSVSHLYILKTSSDPTALSPGRDADFLGKLLWCYRALSLMTASGMWQDVTMHNTADQPHRLNTNMEGQKPGAGSTHIRDSHQVQSQACVIEASEASTGRSPLQREGARTWMRPSRFEGHRCCPILTYLTGFDQFLNILSSCTCLHLIVFHNISIISLFNNQTPRGGSLTIDFYGFV